MHLTFTYVLPIPLIFNCFPISQLVSQCYKQPPDFTNLPSRFKGCLQTLYTASQFYRLPFYFTECLSILPMLQSASRSYEISINSTVSKIPSCFYRLPPNFKNSIPLLQTNASLISKIAFRFYKSPSNFKRDRILSF